MRQRGMGEEPEYRRKKIAAAESHQKAEQQKEIVQAIVSLTTRIDGVATQHSTNRVQNDRHEKDKRKRDWFTFGALVAAACAALLTLIVTHCDTRGIIAEARYAANQQHEDTLAALNKTDAQITALQQQAEAMHGQLAEMRSEQRPWVSAKMSVASPLAYDASGHISQTFKFDLKNTGKQPALRVFAQAMIFDLFVLNASQKSFDEDTERLCNEVHKSTRLADRNSIFDYMLVADEPVVGYDTPSVSKTIMNRSRDKDGHAYFPVYIMGCVTYRSMDHILHHTTYLFWLIDSNGRGIGNFDHLPISQDQLSLRQIGSHAD